MNEIEKIIYSDDNHWHFLGSFTYDEKSKTIQIVVYPNNNEMAKRKFEFTGIQKVSYDYDEEPELNDFPKQILGIDWNRNREVVMNCAEVEYMFNTLDKPREISL